MRKPFVAANWKMHSPPQGWDGEDSPYRSAQDIDVVVFPSFLDIHTCLEKFLTVGAQHGRPEKSGPFTGDLSMGLLAEHGCRYVLCGHSERRIIHGETDGFIAEQIISAIEAGLTPILCVGETKQERDVGSARHIVKTQLSSLRDGCIVAYEPVWAIGTGDTALPSDAQEMHAFIRSEAGADRRILYGGSVKPENAPELASQPDIDGFLVGGASLDPKAFSQIIQAVIGAKLSV